jgi:ABC-type Fe3+-hydroxamate transport system substrate-binding protein
VTSAGNGVPAGDGGAIGLAWPTRVARHVLPASERVGRDVAAHCDPVNPEELLALKPDIVLTMDPTMAGVIQKLGVPAPPRG